MATALRPLRNRLLLAAAAVYVAVLLAVTPAAGADAAEAVRFVAVGDTGTGSAGQYRVAATLRTFCARRGCDFVLLLGDNFYPAGVASADDPLWTERFERPYGALDVPFHVALGNHDYGRNLNHLDFARAGPQIAYGADHPRWVLPAPFHHFRRGPATFLALDTTRLLVGGEAAAARQSRAFAPVLAGAATPWVIAFGHHPFVSAGPTGSAGAYHRHDRPEVKGRAIRRFFEQRLCGRIDVYFAGHDHNRQVLAGPPDCPGLFVVSGAGAMAEGFGRARGGDDRGVRTHFRAASLGFAFVRLTPERLVLEMVDAEGRTDYRHVLRRAP